MLFRSGEGRSQAVVHLADGRSSREYRQDSDADSIDCIPNRLVEYHLLPADTIGNADDIRTDTMGVLTTAEMGKQLGEVADKVSDRAFLWSDALLRGIISMCNSLTVSIVILQNTST